MWSAETCGDVRTATATRRLREPSGQEAKQSNEDERFVGKENVAGDEQIGEKAD